MHNFRREGKNYIFSSKTMIILVWVIRCKYCILKEALSERPFVAHHSNSGFKHQGNPIRYTGWIVLILLPEDFIHLENAVQLFILSFPSFFSFFWAGFPFEYIFPFSLANVNKLTCYKQIYSLYFGGRQFLCLCKELYSLLLGWYHPLCNFLSYLKKYINTVYYQDYR